MLTSEMSRDSVSEMQSKIKRCKGFRKKQTLLLVAILSVFLDFSAFLSSLAATDIEIKSFSVNLPFCPFPFFTPSLLAMFITKVA